MGNYKRMQRPGFTLYHEDMEMLHMLPPKQFKAFLEALWKCSAALAMGEEPQEPRFSGWAGAMWPNFAMKVRRDHQQYTDKCEQKRKNARAATASDRHLPPPKETVTAKEEGTENGTGAGPVTESEAAPGAQGAAVLPPPMPLPTMDPPTVQEVSDYCERQGLKMDAQRFLDYNASKGWTVGGAPMRDWRAAARAWAAREPAFAQHQAGRGKTVGEQQYSQRAYAHDESAMDAMMAEFLQAAAQGSEMPQ